MVKNTSKEIGDLISFAAEEEQDWIIHTEKENDINITTKEVPISPPTHSHQMRVVVGDIAGTENIIDLFADILEMKEMSIRYDVYANKIDECGKTTELGEIEKIELPNK